MVQEDTRKDGMSVGLSAETHSNQCEGLQSQQQGSWEGAKETTCLPCPGEAGCVSTALGDSPGQQRTCWQSRILGGFFWSPFQRQIEFVLDESFCLGFSAQLGEKLGVQRWSSIENVTVLISPMLTDHGDISGTYSCPCLSLGTKQELLS